MMIKNIYIKFVPYLCLFTLMLWISSCGESDPITELKVDKLSVTVFVDESVDIQIKSGNGGYVISVSIEEIIDYQINGNTISITGKRLGETIMTIRDQAGKIAMISLKVQASGEVISWEETGHSMSLPTKIGIPAYDQMEVDYKRGGLSVLQVKLQEPIVAAVASKPEKWGYFQFPSIEKRTDGKGFLLKWNMAADDVNQYGKGGLGFVVSEDGKDWQAASSRPFTIPSRGLELPNGEFVTSTTLASKPSSELTLPAPVAVVKETNSHDYAFYRLKDLPQILQGVYIARSVNRTSWAVEHNTMTDHSNALRYSDSGVFPVVVWWGDLRNAPDNSIIAGTYPGFYENEDGSVSPSGISYYRSTDNGRSWSIQGNIPYKPDLSIDPTGNNRTVWGFTEPATVVLNDGSIFCVTRSTNNRPAPMYYSRSTDLGKTWTTPKAFTPNGVKPRLLQLKNGVIVLVSGRPGVQLRFSIDGKGEKWTDPFDVIPFKDGEDPNSHTCGYPEVLITGDDSFLFVYSDFKHQTSTGEIRKAIKVREVTIQKK